ncbi:hypothetical protein M3Y96_00341000 [Aphelenchoides besseyi]|nr:hypothetical protein M3Y96_00341000 [Aphelenchoides besseyi]
MAGPLTVAQKRAREMAANRSASMDQTVQQKIRTPPIHHSSDAIATPTQIAMSVRSKLNSPALKNYFCPVNSFIRFGKLQFLITDRPTERTLDAYIADLERHRASVLVRVCEPTYSVEQLEERGIKVYDWEFEDGQPPSSSLIAKWIQLCAEIFASGDSIIAVHCVSGLGRSPLLVGIALLETRGLKYEDVIFLIRSQRRGALNEKQLEFLRLYKPTGKLRFLRYETEKQRTSCSIM